MALLPEIVKFMMFSIFIIGTALGYSSTASILQHPNAINATPHPDDTQNNRWLPC
jgi:hypothetical protein